MSTFASLFIVILITLVGWLFSRRFRSVWLTINLVAVGFGLVDWSMLAALPRLGLSFGSIDLPLTLITLIRSGLLLAALTVLAIARSKRVRHAVAWLSSLIQGIILLIAFYSLYIEPFHLTITEQQVIQTPAFIPGRPLRIMQISDLHIERITRREWDVLAAVDRLQPDMIVLTGDFVNLDYLDDPLALQDTWSILSRLSAPYGVFAVAGTTDTPYMMTAISTGLNIRVLNDEMETISFPGGDLYLLGVSNTNDRARDQSAFESLMAIVPHNVYTILLYHTPDMIEAASASGIDLYFAGHTHGGQVRLPFYGAIVTFSRYGKKYEMGRYQVGPTTMLVSRGIGMEGMGLPRVRFLCPPELVIMGLGD
jgi:uncharacterized protein